MNFFEFLFAFVAGMGLGVLFFGGLWLTVRRLARAKFLAINFALSFVLRSVLTLLGFYLIMGTSWERLLIALLGFILARLLLSRIIALSPGSKPAEKVFHEVQSET